MTSIAAHEKQSSLPPRLRLYGCPLPNEDETFSSWLIRASYRYLISARDLIGYCFGSGLDTLINIDPDVTTLERILESLASKLGTSTEKFTSLIALTPRTLNWPSDAWLHENLNYSRLSSAFCPQCLATDKEPYFRNQWRYTSKKTCSVHGSLLLQACPHCNLPVHPFRHKTTRPIGHQLLDQCPYCRNSLHMPPSSTKYFERNKVPHRSVDTKTSRPFLLLSSKKKKRRPKIRTLPKHSSHPVDPLKKETAIEQSSALELGRSYGTWSSQLKTRFLMCINDPVYRLVTLQQEREEYNLHIVSSTVRAIHRFAQHYSDHSSSGSPPNWDVFDVPKFIRRSFNSPAASLVDLPKVVQKVSERLKVELHPSMSKGVTQIIERGIEQCDQYLIEIVRLKPNVLVE